MRLIDKDGRLSQVAEAHVGHLRVAWSGIVRSLKERGASRQDLESMAGLVGGVLHEEIVRISQETPHK